MNFARQQVETVDFATSNLRGAPWDLFIAGAEILGNHPMGPTGGTAFNATVLSYRGGLDMGLNIDTAAIDDPALLRDCIRESFDELLAVKSLTMPGAALKRTWKALASVEDFEIGENIFGGEDDPAYWVNATQVANLVGEEGLALRLTRKVISAHRPGSRPTNASISAERRRLDRTCKITKPADTTLAVELAELAADAHRPADGSPCKPPPMGADLARRKRFH